MLISISFYKKNSTKLLQLIFFLSLILSSVNHSQPISNPGNLYSPINRLKFGNHLFMEKDYLRAINEFREYLKYEENDTVLFRFAECFYRIGRYEESSNNFKTLFYNSTLTEEARLGFYKSIFFMNEFTQFRELTRHGNYLTTKYTKDVNRLRFISHFFDNSVINDTSSFFSAFNDSNKSDIRNFYLMKKYPQYKNPTTAAILSAALPGLGKIYVGEVGDGITSLITTGLLTFLSVTNFQRDHNFRGWLFTGLAVLSYGGNIYGSAAAAQIYNAGIKFGFDSQVKLYFEKRNYFLPKVDIIER